MWMQNLQSLNFEALRADCPELANIGGYAEHYAYSDPESSLVKLRNFVERVTDRVYIQLRLPRAPQSNFMDRLENASFTMVVDRLALDKFHLLRKLGNKAAHGETVTINDALRGVHEAWQLGRWLHVTFLNGSQSDFGVYRENTRYAACKALWASLSINCWKPCPNRCKPACPVLKSSSGSWVPMRVWSRLLTFHPLMLVYRSYSHAVYVDR